MRAACAAGASAVRWRVRLFLDPAFSPLELRTPLIQFSRSALPVIKSGTAGWTWVRSMVRARRRPRFVRCALALVAARRARRGRASKRRRRGSSARARLHARRAFLAVDVAHLLLLCRILDHWVGCSWSATLPASWRLLTATRTSRSRSFSRWNPIQGPGSSGAQGSSMR